MLIKSNVMPDVVWSCRVKFPLSRALSMHLPPDPVHDPEWTRFRMDTIPNGHNPEWTPYRMDTIPNGHNPERTQS